MKHHIKNYGSSQRGGAAIYVLGAVLLGGAAFALSFDFEQFGRDRELARLEKSVTAFQTARMAEDTQTIRPMFAQRTSDTFDTDHLAELCAFDTTEVVGFEATAINVDWRARTATVTAKALVRSGEEAASVSHDVVNSWSIVDGDWKVQPASEPWGRSIGVVLHKERQNTLEKRVGEYVTLRLSDDQEALYAMLRAADRAKTSLGEYLSVFGQHVLKVHTLEPLKYDVSANGREALVELAIDCEMIVANLPPEMRRNLRNSGTDTRAQSNFAMKWHYADDTWYFEQEEKPVRENETYAKGAAPGGGPAPLPTGAAGPQVPATSGDPK